MDRLQGRALKDSKLVELRRKQTRLYKKLLSTCTLKIPQKLKQKIKATIRERAKNGVKKHCHFIMNSSV